MTEYKALLHQWYKGTGGGPGLDVYFESWSQEKRDKYDVDLDTYDHTIVTKRPVICIENYNQDVVKKPYLTIIHMWDEISINLLSSKYDPFVKDTGEIGMGSSSEEELHTESASSSTPSPSRKKKQQVKSGTLSSHSKRRKKKKDKFGGLHEEEDDIRGAINAVLKMKADETPKKTKNKKGGLQDLTSEELFTQMESHKSHLKFLQENDMCTPEEKAEIVGQVKAIYKLVTMQRNSTKDVS